MVTCAQYQDWQRQNGMADTLTLQMLQNMRGLQIQQCPTCWKWIQRTEGCNHMTCVCGKEFCYVCGKAYPCDNDEH